MVLAGDVAGVVGGEEGGDPRRSRRARRCGLSGVRERILLRAVGSEFTLASISVMIEPGPIALTRMPVRGERQRHHPWSAGSPRPWEID